MRVITHEHYNWFLNRKSRKRTICFDGEELEQPILLYASFFLFGIFWAYITVSDLGVKPISEWIGGLVGFDLILFLLGVGMGKFYSGGIKTGLATAIAWFLLSLVAIVLTLLVQ